VHCGSSLSMKHERGSWKSKPKRRKRPWSTSRLTPAAASACGVGSSILCSGYSLLFPWCCHSHGCCMLMCYDTDQGSGADLLMMLIVEIGMGATTYICYCQSHSQPVIPSVSSLIRRFTPSIRSGHGIFASQCNSFLPQAKTPTEFCVRRDPTAVASTHPMVRFSALVARMSSA
jgi:hypothetical protein